MPKPVPAKEIDKTAKATISLNFNTESQVSRKDIDVVLRNKEGLVFVKPHPRSDVDVAGLMLPPEIVFPSEENTDGSVLSPISEDRIMTMQFQRLWCFSS